MQMNEYLVGLDVGSTTVKVAVVDPESRELLYADYLRHNAAQAATARELLEAVHELFPETALRLAVCGSGGSAIAERLGAFFIQEVVANSLAIKEHHPETHVAIELGGQDAKVIFFRRDETSGALVASDMRMNGSCAGGTGAFIDQVAELLGVTTEEFEPLAAEGSHVYEISGRCGVFAKTDIQPLLNQGVSKQDLALSAFHAIAKQTIGGLAQGMEITAPVVFEGGPLTFNPTLVRVFQERLALTDEQIIIPGRPEIIVAYGAALSAEVLYGEKPSEYRSPEALLDRAAGDAPRSTAFGDAGTTDTYPDAEATESNAAAGHASNAENLLARRFFESPEERAAFEARYPKGEFHPVEYAPGERVGVYIGIDAGSTTTKFVLLDESENVVNLFYSGNHGDPLEVTRQALIEMREAYAARGVELQILGLGTTGYGEGLFATALGADYHTVETVAHAEAAQKWARDEHHPDGASFVLDIGGQDMKAISLKGGIVTGIVLNEACSAGCGSFVETYARSLGVPVDQIAPLAFAAENPSRLGSRCTVFMNSSIITEQKNGRTSEDILAGICRSIVENVFTKVVRISNLQQLGDRVVVQGGTFKNDAVLRAFEQHIGAEVVRPPLPGEMGAIGIALLTKHHMEQQSEAARRAGELNEGERLSSQFIGLTHLEQFTYHKQPGVVCEFCSNSCRRTVVTFSDGRRYITGNRCERGQILGDTDDPAVKKQLGEASRKLAAVPDMMSLHGKLLTRRYSDERYLAPQGVKIGLPRALEFWNSLPYWRTVFETLGFEVVISSPSTYETFETGLAGVPSDTVCFPAKLAHGHVNELVRRGVDRVFMPMMIRVPKENKSAQGAEVCPVVQGYPLVIHHSDEPTARHGVAFDHPALHFYNAKHRRKQTRQYFAETFGLRGRAVDRAINDGERALAEFRYELRDRGRQTLEQLTARRAAAERAAMARSADASPAADVSPASATEDGEYEHESFAVVLAGRPYHADQLVNHQLARHFTAAGIPVLTLDSVATLHDHDVSDSRFETYNPFHTRLISAAHAVAEDERLELVQIVSFGCGHDAITSDEVSRILAERSDKELLVLKLDEGEAVGPLSIRIKSFIETIRAKRAARARNPYRPHAPAPKRSNSDPFPVKFTKADRKKRTILVPVLSEPFSYLASKVLERLGYNAKPLPIADKRAIELGKQFVHNDICYPAQMNVGEALAYIERSEEPAEELAVGLAKNCIACRAAQYAALARKALDDAGYPEVPLITTGRDTKDMHPGFKLSPMFQLHMLWGLTMIDGLEHMRQTTRPYERAAGETDRAFHNALEDVTESTLRSWREGLRAFRRAVRAFNRIPVDRRERRPRVGIVGEILLNFHDASNGYVQRYLERNGMETIIPGMTEFFRKSPVAWKDMARRRLSRNAFLFGMVSEMFDRAYEFVYRRVRSELEQFRFFEREHDMNDVISDVSEHIDPSFTIGEGWLMPGEIIQMAKHGVDSFVILNPFACMPNHVTGRGMIKMLKREFPHIQVVSLDFDPDTALANIENRLQMLIINARELEQQRRARRDHEREQQRSDAAQPAPTRSPHIER